MSTPLPYAGICTFARAPQATAADTRGADVAVLGVPFDSSTSYRSGARFGPRAIREQSLMLWGYNNALGVAPLDVLKVVDAGDVDVTPVNILATYAATQAAASSILNQRTKLLTLGGDHSQLLPLLRAHAAVHGPLALVHFDAHGDTWDSDFPGEKYSHGTPVRRAFEEGLIDPEAYFQIGIRGPTYGPQDYADAVGFGAKLVTRDLLAERGIHAVLAEVHAACTAGNRNRPVYCTLDIDVCDPAFAPGTGTPEVGGLTSYELLQLVRGLQRLKLVGADIVEVAPAYDHAQITSLLAANLGFEFLSLLALEHLSAVSDGERPA